MLAIINDTVGTMVAAAHECGGQCDVGVIIGMIEMKYSYQFSSKFHFFKFPSKWK